MIFSKPTLYFMLNWTEYIHRRLDEEHQHPPTQVLCGSQWALINTANAIVRRQRTACFHQFNFNVCAHHHNKTWTYNAAEQTCLWEESIRNRDTSRAAAFHASSNVTLIIIKIIFYYPILLILTKLIQKPCDCARAHSHKIRPPPHRFLCMEIFSSCSSRHADKTIRRRTHEIYVYKLRKLCFSKIYNFRAVKKMCASLNICIFVYIIFTYVCVLCALLHDVRAMLCQRCLMSRNMKGRPHMRFICICMCVSCMFYYNKFVASIFFLVYINKCNQRILICTFT